MNAVFLFAIGVAAAVGRAASCSKWNRSLLVLAICAVAAFSLIPYLPDPQFYSIILLLEIFGF